MSAAAAQLARTAQVTGDVGIMNDESCPRLEEKMELEETSFFGLEMMLGIWTVVMLLLGVLIGMSLVRARPRKDTDHEECAAHPDMEPHEMKCVGSQTEPLDRRTVGSQAPCTYKWWWKEPRFSPLPAYSHG